MIPLLRLFTLPHVRRHRLRTLLTLLGIALGVAAMTSVNMVNRTLAVSFRRTIELVAGKAVLQVSHGESGIMESLFPIVRDTPGVKDAAPSVEGFLPVAGHPGERLFVLGVDLLSDFTLRNYEWAGEPRRLDALLDFIARSDSIALTESFAGRLGLSVGSRIRLATSRGVRDFTVRALLQEQGAAKVFGGNFALMDLPAAQMAFGKQGKLDVIDLTVEDGVAIDAVAERLEKRVGGAAQVQRPRARSEQVESLLTSFRVGLFFVSLIALFVAFFLIYNTVSVSVIQRKREIGILRCLGILRRKLLALFVGEALIMGLLGSLLGLLTGFLLAKAAVISVARTLSNLFAQVDMSTARLSASDCWVALGCGVGVTLFAAAFPSWRATEVSPLESARQTPWSARSRVTSWASPLGCVLMVIAPVVWLSTPSGWSGIEKFTLGIGAALIFLLGVCFLSPLAIVGWGALVRRGLRDRSGSFWVTSRLASDSLGKRPGRSGMTVATLTISLASVFTIAAFIHSVRGSLLSWIDQMVTADVIVHSGDRTAGPRNVPLTEELAAELESLPGVRAVDLYRLIRSSYRGKPIVIESFSAEVSRHLRRLPMVEGDREESMRQMAEGKGVLISESFQIRFGNGRGDTLQLPTPSGPVTFPILGVYVDYSSDSGSVLIDRALYKKIWRDPLVDAFDLWLEPRAKPVEVVENILRLYGEPYHLFISTHAELRESVVDILEQSFTVNYAVEFVAVVVAVFSIVNTLLASVWDRAREIGVLRVMGATQRQVRAVVMVEGGFMGLIGGVLGIIAGTVMSYHHVVYNTKALTGWTFQYHYPFGLAVLAVIAAVLLSLVAGYLPAKRAARSDLATAIAYE